MKKRIRGFTLVELLVVIGIISILMSLILPAIQSSREAARRLNCANKLRQISLASINFESTRRHYPLGYFSGPPITDSTTRPNFDASFGKTPYMAILTQLLPYIERSELWDETLAAYGEDWFPFNGDVHLGATQLVDEFLCPSSVAGWELAEHSDWGTVALTTYLGVNGTNFQVRDGLYCIDTKRRPAEIIDGLSNTLAFGERPPSNDLYFGWWYSGAGINGTLMGTNEINGYLHSNVNCEKGPYRYQLGNRGQCDSLHFWSNHPGGCNFALADGSLKFIEFDISQELINGLGTIKGKEVASTDQ